MRFRKKPIIVEAQRLDPSKLVQIVKWLGDSFASPSIEGLTIHTYEGDMLAQHGDWIIKGVRGEFYPCKHEIFIETYEAVV